MVSYIRLLGYSEKDMERYFNNPKALMPRIVRVSIGMYNTFEEVDRFLYSLNIIAMNKNYYIKKYEFQLNEKVTLIKCDFFIILFYKFVI